MVCRRRTNLPMRRDVAEPGDAGGLEWDVGVEAAGDGAVDDGLLLLVQQPNQLPLGADEAVDLPVRVVQKPHDGRLFVLRWKWQIDQAKVPEVQILPVPNEVGCGLQRSDVIKGFEEMCEVVHRASGEGFSTT